MNLLYRLARYLETKRVEGEIHRQLARLTTGTWPTSASRAPTSAASPGLRPARRSPGRTLSGP